jgi:hypothetical protein
VKDKLKAAMLEKPMDLKTAENSEFQSDEMMVAL